MEREIIIIAVVCFVTLVVLAALTGSASAPRQKRRKPSSTPKPKPPSPQQIVQRQRWKERRALRNYKNWQGARESKAIDNYRNYQRLQRKSLWKQRRQGFLAQTKNLVNEAFPQFSENPELRGQLIAALLSRLFQSIMTDSPLSPEWEEQKRTFMDDLNGSFLLRQEIIKWYQEKKQELDDQLEGDEIDEETYDLRIKNLESLYHEALSRLDT